MATLFDYFHAAYVINLPERTDRRQSTEQELNRIGSTLGPGGVQIFPAQRFGDRGTFPSAGVRGAFHSHWHCLRQAQEEHKPHVLILEDDIAFSPLLPQLVPAILARLAADDWDVVFFGHEATGSIQRADARSIGSKPKFLPWSDAIEGLHFYAVHGRILERLTDHLARVANGREGDQVMGPMPVDGALNNFRWLNPDIRTLIVDPKAGWQRPSRSDITPGTIDRIRLLRPLTTGLRELKHLAHRWLS
jgi:glycosyl transferase, family 25